MVVRLCDQKRYIVKLRPDWHVNLSHVYNKEGQKGFVLVVRAKIVYSNENKKMIIFFYDQIIIK